jgi:hypothetical protein
VPALAARLPRATLGYARVASLTRLAAEVRQQAPWRIWREEEVQTFWESVRERMFSGPWADELSGAFESAQQLALLFAGPVSLVVVSSGDREHAALVFEGCNAGKATDLLLDELARGPLAGVLRGRPRIEQLGGLKVRTYPHPVSDIVAAASGTTMIFGDDKELVARLCGGEAAPVDEPTLAETPAFREAWAAAGTADPTVFVFIHTGSAVDALRAGDKAEAAAAGLDNVRGIGMSLWAEGGEVFDRVTLQTPGGRGGFLAGIAPGPTKAAASKAAPATTLFMSAIPVDLPALHAAAQAVEGAGHTDLLRELEELLVGRLHLKLNEDLLQPLGKEFTFLVILPSGGALIPEFALLAEVRNQAALEKNVDLLVTKGMEAELKETTFSGHKIRYVSQKGGHGFSLNVTLSYAFAGGYLVMGSHPNAVKRILNTMNGKAAALADDEAFAAAFARAEADGEPAGLVYFNTKRTFEYLHGIATPILGLVGGREELPFDPGSIPTAESVSKHLSVAVNALRLTKDALEIRSFSDGVSLSTISIYGFAAGACLELRSIVQARTGSARQCHSNLERIGAKIETYRKAKGTYPALAEEIWGEHLEEWERGRSEWLETCQAHAEAPDQQAPPPPPLAEAAPEGRIASYAYFPEEVSLGAKDGFPAGTMLLYERAPFHRGCRIVLFAGGRTDWLPEDDFQKRLAAQTAEARAAVKRKQ